MNGVTWKKTYANTPKDIAQFAHDYYRFWEQRPCCHEHNRWIRDGRLEALRTILHQITGQFANGRWQEFIDAMDPVAMEENKPCQPKKPR